MSDETFQETDVSTESTSSSQEDSGSSAQDQVEAQDQEDSAKQEASDGKQVPFHEHPRFKELIEQKNTLQGRISEYETRMNQLQAQYEQAMNQFKAAQPKQQPQQPYKPVLDRLQGIDPEFAAMQAQLLEVAQALPSIQQEINAYKTEQLLNTYDSKLKGLFETNKVPNELRSVYKAQIDNAFISNRQLGLNDIEKVFSSTHSGLNSYIESLRRSERESYLKEKKKDAVPNTRPDGVPVSAPQSPKQLKFNTNEDMIAWMAKELRAGKKSI